MLEAVAFVQIDDITVPTLEPVLDAFGGLIVPVEVGAKEKTFPEHFFEVRVERFRCYRFRGVGDVLNATVPTFIVSDDGEIEKLAAKEAGRSAVCVQETSHLRLLSKPIEGNFTNYIIPYFIN